MTKTTVLVLAALAAAGCARSAADAEGLSVVPLAGEVRLLAGDDTMLLDEATDVQPGDLVSTGVGGQALLHLGAAGRLELGSRAQVRVDQRPELLRGSVLAAAEPSGLAVRAGGAEIEARDSVFRIDRGFSVLVAVYRGAAEILGSGIGDVGELRQTVVLAGGDVPRGPAPLEIQPDHPWDIRLLGPAIDLGLDLDRLQRGLDRALPARDRPAAVARVLDGTISGAMMDDLLSEKAGAETVVAVEVSRVAAELSETPLRGIVDQVLNLRGEGAEWIVVAATWDLAGTSVVENLERLAGIIGRLVAPSPAVFSGGGQGGRGQGGRGGSAGGGSSGSGGSGSTTGDGDSGDSGDSGGTTTGSGGGGSGPAPPPDPCGVGCVVDGVVEDVVDEIGGTVGGGGGVLP